MTGGPEFTARGAVIPDYVFSIGWAMALIAVGVWGVKSGRRWVVNIAAVFGGIHFYTQWFSILGANAISVLLAGVILIAIALGLRAFNKAALNPLPRSGGEGRSPKRKRRRSGWGALRSCNLTPNPDPPPSPRHGRAVPDPSLRLDLFRASRGCPAQGRA